ncbi:hypothetical protein [Nonomuraea angiospora]
MGLGLSLAPTAARAAAGRGAATWENLVEKTSFNSQTAFDTAWNYLYPWDSDPDTHNGAARMDAAQVSLSQGVLTLKATRLPAPSGTSPQPPHAPLWYRSGAIHAKRQIIVNDQFPEYDIEGEFRTQTGPGIWPAFWTTGTWPEWPPETDILEYVGVDEQGKAVNFFNTYYKTASNVEEGDDGWPDQRPGPDGDTYFRARNVWFGRTRAW